MSAAPPSAKTQLKKIVEQARTRPSYMKTAPPTSVVALAMRRRAGAVVD